uniref:insulin receptor substrate 2-A-like n=1 Tax=Jaculus jaculus TaxID=51337 RepID=UPI001E1B2DDA|nr:insulin receptor substrate 2-A-like [Jaculus jaculus]
MLGSSPARPGPSSLLVSSPTTVRSRPNQISPSSGIEPAADDLMATPESESSKVVEPLGPPVPWPCPPDVRLCGHLRKQKSQRRRFFVLRADPPRLDCYESEKKFRAGGCRPARPRRSVSLEGACTISKRSDARQRHLIVLYTPDSSLGVAAADELEQQLWYSALLEVRAAAAAATGEALGWGVVEDPDSCILTPFQDVWPVTLRPKGLGRARGLGSGGYRLCLGSGALSLLRKPGSRGSRESQALPLPVLRLSLLSVRRCGHADSFFFLELGRSAPTGPGELWLQAPDAVVAQSIHETVLAAMKRLGRIASGCKVEPPLRESLKISSSIPNLTVYDTPTLAAQPKSPDERQEQELLKTLESLRAAASYPQELDQGESYITMRARGDYMHMGGSAVDGYMWMAPPGPTSTPDRHQLSQDYQDIEYMPMNNFSSEPSSYKSEPGFQAATRGVGGSSQQLADLAGDYVYLQPGDSDCVGMGTARREPPDNCLNYVDLDLVPPLEVRTSALKAGPHSYASIKF